MGIKMKIPARFERVAAAFEEAGGRLKLICESSGSEHSPESFTDLSDLVNSFMECGEEIDQEEKENGDNVESDDSHRNLSFSDTIATLRKLFGFRENESEEISTGIRKKIVSQAEMACRVIGEKPSADRGFKRKLMTHFRENGFDAGLCKSKWAKFGRFPAGDYEFMDVKVDGNRYIVEVLMGGEFHIARPTDEYASLLEIFPKIYVGKVEELKNIVKLMSTAIRESMKSQGLHVPPWRRNGYMQAKWFASHNRTTNEVPSRHHLPFPLFDLLQVESSSSISSHSHSQKKHLPLPLPLVANNKKSIGFKLLETLPLPPPPIL